MKELAMTRCIICMTSATPGFIAIEDSYPVTMINFTYNPQIPKMISSKDKVWVCKFHYDIVSPNKVNKIGKN